MIDLVLTHLNQPWGPLEPWRPLTIWLKMAKITIIILKIVLWAHFTITHATLRGSTDFFKTTYSGTPYFTHSNMPPYICT